MYKKRCRGGRRRESEEKERAANVKAPFSSCFFFFFLHIFFIANALHLFLFFFCLFLLFPFNLGVRRSILFSGGRVPRMCFPGEAFHLKNSFFFFGDSRIKVIHAIKAARTRNRTIYALMAYVNIAFLVRVTKQL